MEIMCGTYLLWSSRTSVLVGLGGLLGLRYRWCPSLYRGSLSLWSVGGWSSLGRLPLALCRVGVVGVETHSLVQGVECRSVGRVECDPAVGGCVLACAVRHHGMWCCAWRVFPTDGMSERSISNANTAATGGLAPKTVCHISLTTPSLLQVRRGGRELTACCTISSAAEDVPQSS